MASSGGHARLLLEPQPVQEVDERVDTEAKNHEQRHDRRKFKPTTEVPKQRPGCNNREESRQKTYESTKTERKATASSRAATSTQSGMLSSSCDIIR